MCNPFKCNPTDNASPTWALRLFWYIVAVYAAVIVGVLLGRAAQAETLPIWPLECGIEKEVPVETFMVSEYQENGLEVFWFDTDGNGQRDVAMYIPQGDENRYPLYYAFDRTGNDKPDIVYGDTHRDGTCDGIGVVWYEGMEMPSNHRKEGEPVDCVRNNCDRKMEGDV